MTICSLHFYTLHIKENLTSSASFSYSNIELRKSFNEQISLNSTKTSCSASPIHIFPHFLHQIAIVNAFQRKIRFTWLININVFLHVRNNVYDICTRAVFHFSCSNAGGALYGVFDSYFIMEGKRIRKLKEMENELEEVKKRDAKLNALNARVLIAS